MVTNFSEFLKDSGGLTAISSGVQAFASGIAKAIDLLPLLIGGLVAAKTAAIGFSIASSFGALTKGAILDGHLE